ncbi:unknown [Clostridium sp. CAG:508]|nr:unknown [Clostridium sp. CAG:508]
MENSNLTTSIIETINSIFETLFSSIDTTIYSVLDELTFIDKNILNNSIFQKIFGSTGNNGLLVIANSLLVGFSLYYAIRLIYSYYMNLQIERPYQFIFKLLIFGIVMNCSYFICNQFIQINSFISDAIRTVGSNIFGHDISFSELINKLNYLSIKENEFNIFSFDGLIKSFISISLFNLIFSYSLRYIMVKVFILITPFAILSLINESTSWFFKTWLRTVLSLLFQQSLVAIILLIIFSFNFSSNNIISQLMCIGGIYALARANSYIRSLIGGISTDVSNNFNISSKFLKNI